MMKKYILFLVSVMCSLLGQSQTLQATVNRNAIMQKETIQYTLTLSDSDGDIRLPNLKDFDIVQGPSTSNSIQIINGKRSTQISETYWIRPKKMGRLVIPAATAKVAKGIIKSNEVSIEVGESRNNNQKGNGEFFCSVTTSKKKVYVGEPIVASYDLYVSQRVYNHFRGNISAQQLDFDETDGFWAENLDIPEQWENEVIEGVAFKKYTLQHMVLFPQTSGELKVGGMYIRAKLGGGFFQNSKLVESSSDDIKINVAPLPASPTGKNDGTYTDLKIEANVDKSTFSSNEAFNLEIKISGRGNLKLLSEPQLNWPSDFEVFDPKIKDKININKFGESGSRTYEYVVIPRSAGSFELDGIDMSYFDYKKEKFQTISSQDFVFEVARGAGGETQTYTYNSKTDVNILNQDILFLKTGDTQLKRPTQYFFGSIGFYGLLATPWLAFIGLLAVRRRKESEEADVVGTKKRKAGKAAKKHLANAQKVMDDSSNFYTELYRALTDYASSKFNLPNANLTRERIAAAITASHGKDIAGEFTSLMEACEMARFAPSASSSPQSLLQSAESIIEKIEKA